MSSPPGEIDFHGLIEPVARYFLGEPNKALSTRDELRFGSNGSLSVKLSTDQFYDHEAEVGGGVVALITHTQAWQHDTAMEWLRGEFPARFAPKPNGDAREHEPRGVFDRAYPYVDEHGVLLYEVVRKRDPKTFTQRRPVPRTPQHPDGWDWHTKGVRQVIYRLPEVLAAIAEGRPILIVEGEKDVDRCWSLGLAATCNAGGAGKWRSDLNRYLRGADVIVIGDHDPQKRNKDGELQFYADGRPIFPGQDHADTVAKRLAPVAARVRLLRDLGNAWSECPVKGDISDWFDAGKTTAELMAIVETLPDYTPPAVDEAPADDKPLHLGIGDSTLAELFAEQDDEGRYDREWRTWDGTRWRGDAELRVLLALRTWLKREIAPTLKVKKERAAVESNGKLHAIEHELRLLRAVSPDQWDAQPWLLNTPVGTWELKGTPRLREHRRGDHLTRMAGCSAGGECPLWLDHIAFVTNGDAAYARYLQKLCGYALTGVRTAQIFGFLFGGGGNGKGVFLQTLAFVFGDYAATMMAEAFLERRFQKHDEEMMPLRGARLVIASEFPEGGEWNTARLKTVTGGDRVRASYKGQNSIEFEVAALLLMAGNDKPKLQSIDPGIMRRLRLLPFVNAFDDEHRDEDIRDKLKAEAGGILAWCLEGCRLYQAEGLDPPDIVRGATEQYFGEQDLTGQWVAEACDTTDPVSKTRIGVLFESWIEWAKAAGVGPHDLGDITRLSARLGKLGFDRWRTTYGRGFAGISLKVKYDDD